MKTENVQVRGDGRTLGDATFDYCESSEDLTSLYSPEQILQTVNAAARTEAANKFRRSKLEGTKVTDQKILELLKSADEETKTTLFEAIQNEDDKTIRRLVLGPAGTEPEPETAEPEEEDSDETETESETESETE